MEIFQNVTVFPLMRIRRNDNKTNSLDFFIIEMPQTKKKNGKKKLVMISLVVFKNELEMLNCKRQHLVSGNIYVTWLGLLLSFSKKTDAGYTQLTLRYIQLTLD